MWPSPVSSVRRGADLEFGDGNGNMAQLPGWAVMVFLADFLVFFPVLFYIAYTLSHIFPTLAMIEDPQPPAYTALSPEDEATDTATKSNHEINHGALTTTSFRRTDRLLRSVGGWTANFRGLACAIALNFAASFAGGAVSWAIPRQFGFLVAALATVQLSTAWTHIVITTPSPLPFWKRLPPFGKAFKASWLPITAYWAATQVTLGLPVLLGNAFGLTQWDPSSPTAVPNYNGHAVWQSFVVLFASVSSLLLLVIPTEVILVRVQASLLPADADTIVPFDRSFGGKVEPEVVTGRGYVDFQTAWITFERASWIRLYRLMGKITLVTLLAYVLILSIVVPEFLLMLKTSESA